MKQNLDILSTEKSKDRINIVLSDIDNTEYNYKLYERILTKIDELFYKKIFKNNIDEINNLANQDNNQDKKIKEILDKIIDKSEFTIIRLAMLYPDYNFEYTKYWLSLMNVLRDSKGVSLIREWAISELGNVIEGYCINIDYNDELIENIKEKVFILEKILIQVYFFQNIELQKILDSTEEKISESFDKFESIYFGSSGIGSSGLCIPSIGSPGIGSPGIGSPGIGSPPERELNEEILKLKDIWNEIIYPKMKQYYEILLPKVRVLVFNIIDYVYNYKRAFYVNNMLKNYSFSTNYNDDIYIRDQHKVQQKYHDEAKKMRENRTNKYENYMNNAFNVDPYFRKIKYMSNNNVYYRDYFKELGLL